MKNNESKTWLKKGIAVDKGDRVIAFRGEIDSLYAECIHACSVAEKGGFVFQGLTEITKVIGGVMRCEALCESTEFCGVFGYSGDELREVSQKPGTISGGRPFLARMRMRVRAWLRWNRLRTEVRRCEREAVWAYPECEPWQLSIIACLNRLSSAVYILMLKLNLEEKNDHRNQ